MGTKEEGNVRRERASSSCARNDFYTRKDGHYLAPLDAPFSCIRVGEENMIKKGLIVASLVF